MVSIFAAIVLTAFVVGAGLYLWFRSILTDIVDVLMTVDVDLSWAGDCIEDEATRNLVFYIRERVQYLMDKCEPRGLIKK